MISLLPGGNRHDPHLAAETTRALIAAMTDTGVKRLIVVSAYPLVADRPRLPVWTLRRLLAKPRSHTRADTASVLLDLAENATPVQTAINVSGT